MIPAATKVSRLIRAPRAALYRACLDADALAKWRVPTNMTATVHDFDARVGGRFRMSLTYKDATPGKSGGFTDTFEGRFVEIVLDTRIVETVRFQSEEAKFGGEMRMTTSFADAPGGTKVTMVAEDLPSGVRPEDNEEGTRQALDNLAKLVERPI